MNTENNKQVVQDFFDAGNRGDMERCMELMHDEVSWTDIGTTKFSGTYKGKANIGENLLGPLMGQLKAGIYTEVDNLIAEGDFVVAQNRGTAETHDGKAYNQTYCHIFTVREGVIVAVTEYMDTALLNEVFGE